jgi:general secretion pathway protein K
MTRRDVGRGSCAPRACATARASASQRGLALLVAMLVAALAAAVAVSVATAQSQWAAQVAHRRDQVQAQSIAQAGVAWAREILDADRNMGPVDYLGEPWALPLPATPVGDGVVEGRIVDAQGLLNVNNLASAAHAASERRRFARLFAALGIPEATLASIVDWVDADDIAQPGGAEDAFYLRQAEPSQAASAPATRIEELSRVRGMTPAALARLVRFASALPPDTALNVNTAPPEVLAAAIGDLDPGEIATLVASRAQHAFGSIADFRARVPGHASIGDEAMYTVGSRYFLVEVRARQGETRARARALIDRPSQGAATIVWQTIE